MKSQQLDTSTTSFTFQVQQKLNLNQSIKCNKGNKAKQICESETCEKYGFICGDEQCECFKDHEDCVKIILLSLLKSLIKKIIPIKSVEDKIHQQIDILIEELSNLKDQISIQFESKDCFLGLSKEEQQFMNSLKKGEFQSICGKKVWSIHPNFKKQKHTQPNVESIQKDVQQLNIKLTKEINELKENIKFGFSNKLNTKIIKQEKDILNLHSFFTEKVKNMKLLYRASEHNFDTVKFYELCHQRPNNLILIETEFGKVIGSFTPLKWNKNGSGVVIDSSKKSFIFSLTNNHKFTYEKNNQRAIYLTNGAGYGPNIGAGCDIVIFNKANENNSSYCNINTSFTNSNYTLGDKKSWESFCGNPNTYNFKTKEWEVFELQF